MNIKITPVKGFKTSNGVFFESRTEAVEEQIKLNFKRVYGTMNSVLYCGVGKVPYILLLDWLIDNHSEIKSFLNDITELKKLKEAEPYDPASD